MIIVTHWWPYILHGTLPYDRINVHLNWGLPDLGQLDEYVRDVEKKRGGSVHEASLGPRAGRRPLHHPVMDACIPPDVSTHISFLCHPQPMKRPHASRSSGLYGLHYGQHSECEHHDSRSASPWEGLQYRPRPPAFVTLKVSVVQNRNNQYFKQFVLFPCIDPSLELTGDQMSNYLTHIARPRHEASPVVLL